MSRCRWVALAAALAFFAGSCRCAQRSSVKGGDTERDLVARIGFNERSLAIMDAPVTGRVGQVSVASGDHVEEGTLLLTLFPRGGAVTLDSPPGLRPYQLTSPMAGTIVDMNVVVGSEVSAGQTFALVTIADLSTLWVTTDVKALDLPLVHVGDRALVRIPARQDGDHPGRISYIGEIVEPETQRAVVRIEMPNLDPSVRPGMLANVHMNEEGWPR